MYHRRIGRFNDIIRNFHREDPTSTIHLSLSPFLPSAFFCPLAAQILLPLSDKRNNVPLLQHHIHPCLPDIHFCIRLHLLSLHVTTESSMYKSPTFCQEA